MGKISKQIQCFVFAYKNKQMLHVDLLKRSIVAKVGKLVFLWEQIIPLLKPSKNPTAYPNEHNTHSPPQCYLR